MAVTVVGGVICVNRYWHEDCYGSCFTGPSSHIFFLASLPALQACTCRLVFRWGTEPVAWPNLGILSASLDSLGCWLGPPLARLASWSVYSLPLTLSRSRLRLRTAMPIRACCER